MGADLFWKVDWTLNLSKRFPFFLRYLYSWFCTMKYCFYPPKHPMTHVGPFWNFNFYSAVAKIILLAAPIEWFHKGLSKVCDWNACSQRPKLFDFLFVLLRINAEPYLESFSRYVENLFEPVSHKANKKWVRICYFKSIVLAPSPQYRKAPISPNVFWERGSSTSCFAFSIISAISRSLLSR